MCIALEQALLEVVINRHADRLDLHAGLLREYALVL